jgi:Tfp pilus assembly protein PilZ
MKRVLIGDQREDLATTFEALIRNWGYRVIVAENLVMYGEILEKIAPEIQIVGPSFLKDPTLYQQVCNSPAPLLTIADPKHPMTPPKGDVLPYPVDIFRLFSLIQNELEETPRRNIRLRVKLPGIYFNGNKSCIAEVLSLSTAGLFLKTGTRLENRDTIRLIFPLFGMQKEMEVSGRIVYQVTPGPENNYMQGIGVEFIDFDASTFSTLERYIEGLLFNELSETSAARRTFDTGHLQPHLLTELLPAI